MMLPTSVLKGQIFQSTARALVAPEMHSYLANILPSVQVFRLWTDTTVLWNSGCGSSARGLSSDRTRHELQLQHRGRSEGTFCWTEEPTLSSGDTQVITVSSSMWTCCLKCNADIVLVQVFLVSFRPGELYGAGLCSQKYITSSKRAWPLRQWPAGLRTPWAPRWDGKYREKTSGSEESIDDI